MGKTIPPNAKLYVVEAGTKATVCKGETCGMTIYFIVNPVSRRPMPIDCAVPGGMTPSEYVNDPTQVGLFGDDGEKHHDGLGVSHFFTCENADDFSKSSRR